MSNWQTCDNCIGSTIECKPGRKDACYMWYQISCPLCGGALSEVREHNGKKYRHCYACHFEYEEET